MEILSYEEFLLALEWGLEERYPNGKIEKTEVYRMNERKECFAIHYSNEICVNIYPEHLYVTYEEMENMNVIFLSIDSLIQGEKMTEYKNMLYTWELVKPYIKPVVFNLEKNKEFIKQRHMVYREMLDLAYGCYIGFPEDEDGGVAMVNITHELLELWEVSEEELFETAEQNGNFCIKSMRTVLEEIVKGKLEEEVTFERVDIMYVLSNEEKRRGAAGMFNTELLAKHAEAFNSNLFILPSSLHEVILLKEEDAPTVEELKSMVCEINETTLLEADYLSDSVYYYDREKKAVEIAG